MPSDLKPCPFSKLGMIEWLHGTSEAEVKKDIVRRLNAGHSVKSISIAYSKVLVNTEKNTVVLVSRNDVYNWLERWEVPVPNPQSDGEEG